MVARLMAEANSYGLPRRYADYSSALLTIALNQPDRGWTANTPVTDHLPPGLPDRFLAVDIISACVIGALAVVILAAVGYRQVNEGPGRRVPDPTRTQWRQQTLDDELAATTDEQHKLALRSLIHDRKYVVRQTLRARPA